MWKQHIWRMLCSFGVHCFCSTKHVVFFFQRQVSLTKKNSYWDLSKEIHGNSHVNSKFKQSKLIETTDLGIFYQLKRREWKTPSCSGFIGFDLFRARNFGKQNGDPQYNVLNKNTIWECWCGSNLCYKTSLLIFYQIEWGRDPRISSLSYMVCWKMHIDSV